MSDKKPTEKAYEHSGETVGAGEDDTAELEHRETARGNASGRNEIGQQRGDEDGYGPRTHEQTRTTRKGED